MQLLHEVTTRAGTTTVRLAGEIDLRWSAELLDMLTGTVRDEQPEQLVVDLHRVTFIDSTGIAALVTARKVATAHGCDFTVDRPQGKVRAVLGVAGMLEILTTPPSRTERLPRGTPPADG